MEQKEFDALIEQIKGALPETVKTLVKESGLKMEDVEKALSEKTITKADFDTFKTAMESTVLELKNNMPTSDVKAKNFREQVIEKYTNEVIERLKKGDNSWQEIEIKSVADMSTGNITGVTMSPLYSYEVMAGISGAALNKPAVIDLIDTANTNASAFIYTERVSEEGSTGTTSETSAKNQIDANWVSRTATLQKITNLWKMSTEMLDDAPSVAADMQMHARELITLYADSYLLAAINTAATAFSCPTELALSIPTPSIYDAIAACATQIRKANYIPTHVFLSIGDAAKMKLTKDSTGQYVLPPFIAANGMQVDGLVVVESNQITTGSILVGDMKKSHARVKGGVTIQMGLNGDDFKNNMRTFICEMRLAHYIMNHEKLAFVKGTIADILEDLTES